MNGGGEIDMTQKQNSQSKNMLQIILTVAGLQHVLNFSEPKPPLKNPYETTNNTLRGGHNGGPLRCVTACIGTRMRSETGR